jgi:hypothetical protein
VLVADLARGLPERNGETTDREEVAVGAAGPLIEGCYLLLKRTILRVGYLTRMIVTRLVAAGKKKTAQHRNSNFLSHLATPPVANVFSTSYRL